VRASAVVGAYRLGAAAARAMPPQVADAAVDVLGSALARFGHDRRLLVERNLRRAIGPELGGRELRRMVAEVYRSYARYYVESFRLPSLPASEIEAKFHVEGFGNIEAAYANGTAPILALPHLGGWEWAGFWLTVGPKLRVTAVAEALEPPELFDWFTALRRSLGMDIVPLGPSAGADVMRALREKHVVCLLSDRFLEGSAVEVEFFGERTRLPAGPATLALRTGAPLLPTAVYFRGDGHHAIVRPPLDTTRTAGLRADVARVTQALAAELERLIRLAPEQWHLMQPNWPSDYEALGRTPPTSRNAAEPPEAGAKLTRGGRAG
jgi:KDO2-lipid IV(A) lauroyltransferase